MSRVPRPAASSTNLRAQQRPSTTATSPRTRKVSSPATPRGLRPPSVTSTKSRPTSPSPAPKKRIEEKPEPRKEKLSLKEQIALKRAEAKKAQAPQGNTDLLDDGPDSIPALPGKASEDIVEMGRWSIRETIERARNSGNLNLSSRSLPCIPSCLFEVHLGVTPKPLDSVTEPEYPADASPKKARQSRQQTSWYEAQDLVILKARSNEIAAIQPELALFGSLKVLDFHSNQLTTLPISLAILSSLTTLDVSNNNLTEIPPALFSLPALSTLNFAHNQLSKLSFARFDDPLDLPKSLSVDGFYQPEVTRSNVPLPSLHTLDVGHNRLTGEGIDVSHLPRAITHITLSHNPLGLCATLITALARLESLQEAILEHATIQDESFLEPPADAFPKLQLLDLTETQVTEQAVRSFFANSSRVSCLNLNMSTAPPSPGELRVSVGKRIVREAWEIEAEQRYLKKKKSAIGVSVSANKENSQPQVVKESWELEADRDLATEGGRRRARAAAAAANRSASNATTRPTPVPRPRPEQPKPKPIEKEQWEIEAEQGLLTEGGRRRLRAQQAAASASVAKPLEERTRKLSSPSSPTSLSSSKYYAASTLTLTLPPSAPPNRSHMRAFSTLAMPQNDRSTEDLLVPAPTLPLATIMQQEFAPKLQVLDLSNRRADPTFSFPSLSSLSTAHVSGDILPRLSELILDGCALSDMVSISHESDDGGVPTVQKRVLLEVIAEVFPWLTVLDLSYNNITSDGLSPAVIERLLVPSQGRKGLKVLRLRGNRLSLLEAFEQVAGLFRGNRQVADWAFEELDVRDNEISKLPPLLGLIPMDVFLVDGNVFRVPPRKVWEREGTKGLLSWLRGRIE